MADDDHPPIGVLLIDDHLVFAESLSRLLADEADIEVLGVVTNANGAVDEVRRLGPRVVLLDYQLPDRDGVQLAADIKESMPEVMIVMLTGSTEDRVLLGAIEAGCSGFLTKDRAAAEVGEAVRAAAGGEALISPALLARLLPKLNRTYRAVGADLTERERDVLALLAKGSPNKVIATELNLSINTIRNYVQSLLGKLGAHSKLEAVSMAVREGIIQYPS